MRADLPPSSIVAGLRFLAAARATLRPVTELPVNASLATAGCSLHSTCARISVSSAALQTAVTKVDRFPRSVRSGCQLRLPEFFAGSQATRMQTNGRRAAGCMCGAGHVHLTTGDETVHLPLRTGGSCPGLDKLKSARLILRECGSAGARECKSVGIQEQWYPSGYKTYRC